MAHSGSRGLGHVAGAVGTAVEAATWPAGLRRPASGVVPVGVGHSDGVARYLAAVEGAANFAEANRAALVAAALRSLEAACGTPVGGRLVWDAPHNLVWDAGDGQYLHRKGATPAGGYDAVAGSDLAALGGEPVLVPGSMGAPSWILVGTGAELTCASACHGAGRRHARGTMRHTSRRARRDADTALDAFLEAFNVITPLDVDDPLVATRRDIVTAWRDRLVEEAPWAYKDVGPAIATLAAAGVARPAVELTPLATIKG